MEGNCCALEARVIINLTRNLRIWAKITQMAGIYADAGRTEISGHG